MSDYPSEIAENLNKNYELFTRNYETAFLNLAERNPADIAKKTESELLSSDKLTLSFFEKWVIVDLFKRRIYSIAGKKLETLDSFSSAIILHFLLTADGAPLTGKWILYRELPDGLFYSDTIPGILQPLIKKYECSGTDFLKRILEIGGKIDKNFKFAGVVYPFKKFPVLFMFEEKDEEFEADMRVLFDSSASHYLKSDIIKTLVVYTVKKLL